MNQEELLKRMIIIYKALLKGWSVRMINTKTFEFTKPSTL